LVKFLPPFQRFPPIGPLKRAFPSSRPPSTRPFHKPFHLFGLVWSTREYCLERNFPLPSFPKFFPFLSKKIFNLGIPFQLRFLTPFNPRALDLCNHSNHFLFPKEGQIPPHYSLFFGAPNSKALFIGLNPFPFLPKQFQPKPLQPNCGEVFGFQIGGVGAWCVGSFQLFLFFPIGRLVGPNKIPPIFFIFRPHYIILFPSGGQTLSFPKFLFPNPRFFRAPFYAGAFPQRAIFPLRWDLFGLLPN